MKKYFLLILVISFPLWNLQAHPHMAIYYSCNFHFEEMELKGAWIDFSFDSFFSLDIINTYDFNGDRSFDNEEVEEIYNHAFINLEKYGFFISIRDSNGRRSPREVTQFKPFINEEEQLTYRFYISMIENEEQEFYFSVYDPTFFCATYIADETPVSVTSDPPVQTDYSIEENTDFPVYYDPYAPASDMTKHEKWRPGLKTYFPEEIHFVY